LIEIGTPSEPAFVLVVFCGWLIFHERDLDDRLIAASVMLA